MDQKFFRYVFIRLVFALNLSLCVNHAFASNHKITLENRTFTSLHFRAKTPTSTYSNWQVVLPGKSYLYQNYPELTVEVWFNDQRTEKYRLTPGKFYALTRSGPTASPEFLAYKQPYQPVPRIPGSRREFDSAPDLTGTIWIGKENLGGYGSLKFRFSSNRRVTMIDAKATRTGNWQLDGTKITLDFPQAKCTYTGSLYGTEMYGTAGKSKWAWTATCSSQPPKITDILPKDRFEPLMSFIDDCERRKLKYQCSLQKLADDYKSAVNSGHIPDEIQFVYGFTQFAGYIVDDENQDIILIGVQDPTLPPIHLDSLVTAMKAAYFGRTPYCSLDPDENDKNYKKSVIGGIPWNSRFAEVMIDADYAMGRIAADQFKTTIKDFPSSQSQFRKIAEDFGLEGEVEKKENGKTGTSNRWWFNFDSSARRTVADEQGKVVYLYRNPIRLSTEMNVAGKFGTGRTTLSNRRFVQAFTYHMDTIGKRYPSIAELQTLFRMFDLMKHARLVSNASIPEMNYWNNHFEHIYEGPPKKIERKEIKYTLKVRKKIPRLLVNTIFIGQETLKGYGKISFTFHGKGRVTMHDSDGATSGTCSISGNNVTMRFYNGSVVYRGTWTPTLMSGTASNGSRSWRWRTDWGYDIQSWTLR